MAHTPDHAKECLEWLNRQMEDAMAAREKRMETAREYWNGKPRTMLNDQLSRIEMEKHHAQYILETAPVRAEREVMIDLLTQVEMAKPPVFVVNEQKL